jgi:hypothetical protein
MKYIKTVKFWITNFGYPDVSFGVHICMDKRIDIHFWIWMISIGNVPVYETNKPGELIAVSNSYHKTNKLPLRAGVP